MDEYKEIIKELNELKSRLAIADYIIAEFKKRDLTLISEIEELKTRLISCENSIINNVKFIEEKIESKIATVEFKLQNLEAYLKPVVNNSLLQFTSTMDVKKWVTIGGIILSILTSAGMLDSFITKTTSDELTNKLEKLIELTQ